MRRLRLLLPILLLAFVPMVHAAGDAKAGKIKAYTCTGCHGIPNYRNAYPTYRVPKLGGQHYDYILAALKAYKAGERKHPTMRAQAESMTDQDMMDIAAYISSVKYTKAK
jgi:cytochrome c553